MVKTPKMYLKGITKRWLFNSMGVIFTILGVVWIFFAFSVHTYYYNTLSQYMLTLAKLNARTASSYLDVQSLDFKQIVDGFEDKNNKDKNNMELLILNKSGSVILSSSDFLPSQINAPQDFITAKSSDSGYGQWSGVNGDTGEKIMAVTSMLKDTKGNVVGAARYVVSLSKVDAQIAILVVISGFIAMVILFFVIMSGIYFINSIVIPVREVSTAARRIASGDFDARIDKQYDDEIGELCDTINYMAGELGATDKMKNDFISSVSHELRTPLTAILGWGETILAATSDKATMKKGMGVIIEETGRLSSMVEELLDFSRMQNGKFRLVLDKIDILAELGEAVLMFSDRAHREGLTFIYNEPESLPAVMGDRNRLKQVFVNVLDNAFKYSEQGGIVAVSTINNQNHIKILISDTGCGIAKGDLSRVKEKFFKGNSTRRGSGIGLAVADEIVCLHGGTLEIDSTEGKGTTVTIALPTVINR